MDLMQEEEIDWEILDAAEDGDEDEILRLAGFEGSNPDMCDRFGTTPLHLASKGGHIPAARVLVEECHVDIDEADVYGHTALHLACIGNHVSMVEYLVDSGANVDSRSATGDTPLTLASARSCKDSVTYLVEEGGANVNAKNRGGDTPLDIAGLNADADIVRYLLPRTTSLSKLCLEILWKDQVNHVEIGRMALEKYFLGRGLSDKFSQYPIHVLLLQIPFRLADQFEDAIKLYPSSYLSLADEQGLLPIHVASASRDRAVKDPLVVETLFEREPRSALSRDPKTGLYPHETLAGLVSGDNYKICSWLNIVYKMIRSNPQHILQSRRAGKHQNVSTEE